MIKHPTTTSSLNKDKTGKDSKSVRASRPILVEKTPEKKPEPEEENISIEFDRNFPILTEQLKCSEKFVNLSELQVKVQSYDYDKLSDAINEFYSQTVMPIVNLIDSEMTDFMGDYWKIMRSQNNGRVAIQTVIVIWLATNDDKVKKYSEQV